MNNLNLLKNIKIQLDAGEEKRLSPWACLSRHALRKNEEDNIAYTINFIHDGELNELLGNYFLVKDTTYEGVPHRFKHFKLIEA